MKTLPQLIQDTAAVDADFAALVEAFNYPAIAIYLNATTTTTVPNPEAQGELPAPLTMGGLVGLLSKADKRRAMTIGAMTSYLVTLYDNPAVTDENVDAVLAKLSANASGNIDFLAAVQRLVESGDRDTLAALVTAMAEDADLEPQSVAAIQAALSATTPDPNWQAEIEQVLPSLAQAAGLGVVTAIQVQGAIRNA